MTTFEIYFMPRTRVITDNIQWYTDLDKRLRISKMYRNLFIGCSFIKIIAVEFGRI